MRRFLAILFVMLMFAVIVLAQETASTPPARDRALISPNARLQAAKNAYVHNVAGNEIPFNVISSAMEGWGRYILVDSPEKADIIVDVSAPEDEKKASEEDNKTKVSGGTGGGGPTPPPTSKAPTDVRIKLVVRDAKTKAVLWAQSEVPKDSFRDKKRNDNLVQVAQHLFEQFHNRVEPPPAAAQ